MKSGHKLWNDEFLGASRFVSTFTCWEDGAPRKHMEAMCPPLLTLPYRFVRLFLSCVFYNKALSVGLFLSFTSHFSELSKLGR